MNLVIGNMAFLGRSSTFYFEIHSTYLASIDMNDKFKASNETTTRNAIA